MTYFKTETIAAMCYALNREWNRANQDAIPFEWPDASTETKAGYLRMVTLFAEGANEETVHKAFVERKRSDGWIEGSFSLESKTHPYLVEYSQLGLRQRLKYLIYRSIVRAFVENKEK